MRELRADFDTYEEGLTLEQLFGPLPELKAAEEDPADGGSSDELTKLLAKKNEEAAKHEAMRARVDVEMRARMDTGVRANPSLAKAFGS